MSGVPGVVNVHQGIAPGGSPQVLSVKALRNTEKKVKKKPETGEIGGTSFNVTLIMHQLIQLSCQKTCAVHGQDKARSSRNRLH